ncbi:hypothetical protein BDM02DRAFT_884535 [Thelephora ganbajun]|uniref:Uncharacterized protein n=1 Tax=Thelephora ganbajun TaxID=370292 RepID=A0ACB6Z505_THEGA|nr:hypothetical protein BDM02DRAFT_884535 [Thelephora ganbajun]
MVNDTVALRDGSSRETKPEDLDDSAKGAQHRRVEKERRDASHETLGRVSLFFKAPPRSLSRNKVLFFAITYLIFGVEAFGDGGFVIALPEL